MADTWPAEDRVEAEKLARAIYDACLLKDSLIMAASDNGVLDYPQAVFEVVLPILTTFAARIRAEQREVDAKMCDARAARWMRRFKDFPESDLQ